MNATQITAWARDQFEVSRDTRSNIRSMEGLRGFAVLLVFFAHYVTQVSPWMAPGSVSSQIGDHLRSLGHVGVDLFFVLSGYLIYGALIRKHRPIVDFLSKRAARIYPTFLFVFGIYLALSFALPQESKLPAEPGAALMYLAQNLLFLPGMVSIEPLIVVSWSLSYEFFYYLVMPLFISALALREWTPARRLWLFVGIATVGFTYYFFTSGHVRLLMFIGGVLLYEVQAQKQIAAPRWSGMAALLTSVAALTVIKHFELTGWFRYTTLFVCMSWLCFECFTVKGGTERLFSWTPLRWLGNFSYSYYLIHGLTLKAFFFMLAKVHAPTDGEDMLFWALLPLVFGGTVIVSAALFICVEKPLSLATSTQGSDTQKAPFAALARNHWHAAIHSAGLLLQSLWHHHRTLAAMKILRQIAAVLVPLGMGLSVYAVIII